MKKLTIFIMFFCTLGSCIQARAMVFVGAAAGTYVIKKWVDFICADTSADLFKACREGRLVAVQRMIKQNVVVNWANDDGITPLMAACEIAHSPIIRILLADRAEVNAIDKNGDTALIYAIRSRSLHAVKTLCEEGHPDLSLEPDDHIIPSEFAQKYNQAIARYLANREHEYFGRAQDAHRHMADEDPVERRRHERRAPAPY